MLELVDVTLAAVVRTSGVEPGTVEAGVLVDAEAVKIVSPVVVLIDRVVMSELIVVLKDGPLEKVVEVTALFVEKGGVVALVVNTLLAAETAVGFCVEAVPFCVVEAVELMLVAVEEIGVVKAVAALDEMLPVLLFAVEVVDGTVDELMLAELLEETVGAVEVSVFAVLNKEEVVDAILSVLLLDVPPAAVEDEIVFALVPLAVVLVGPPVVPLNVVALGDVLLEVIVDASVTVAGDAFVDKVELNDSFTGELQGSDAVDVCEVGKIIANIFYWILVRDELTRRKS